MEIINHKTLTLRYKELLLHKCYVVKLVNRHIVNSGSRNMLCRVFRI